MKVTLSPFEERFADAIAEIERSSFSDPWSRDAFIESSTNIFTEITVALSWENGVGTVCGYTVISSLPPECELLNIAVSKEYRRKGIADILMRDLIKRVSEKGCHTLMLEVRESNLAAKSLYEKLGFTVVGRRRAYYRYPTEDALLMDKKL